VCSSDLVVCNGVLPPNGLGADTATFTTGSASTPLLEVSFGLANEVVEQRVVTAGGAVLLRPVVGRLRPTFARLVVALSAAEPFWRWRNEVLAGSATFRRDVTITFASGASSLGGFQLIQAWPSAYRHLTTSAGTRAVELTLIFADLRDQGTRPVAQEPGAWTATTPLGGLLFRTVSGVESANAVATSTSPTSISYFPGEPELPRLELERHLSANGHAWRWYERTHTQANPRANVTLTATSGEELTVTNSMVFSWAVSLGADGLARETVLLVGETTTHP
jgi:hypothetical protein